MNIIFSLGLSSGFTPLHCSVDDCWWYFISGSPSFSSLCPPDDLNSTHQHCVLAGDTARFSSTHRVAEVRRKQAAVLCYLPVICFSVDYRVFCQVLTLRE